MTLAVPVRWFGVLVAAWIACLPAVEVLAQEHPPLAEPVPTEQATTQDMVQGMADGEADADGDVNAAIWFAAGCLLTWAGVLFAWVIEPSPPPSRLMGKSPAYTMAYAEAYQAAAVRGQVTSAVVGCLTLGAVYALAFTFAATQANGL